LNGRFEKIAAKLMSAAPKTQIEIKSNKKVRRNLSVPVYLKLDH